MLEFQSEAVANCAYLATLNHDVYDRRANSALTMVILRSQKPVQLTAAGFIPLSMESFGTVSALLDVFNLNEIMLIM